MDTEGIEAFLAVVHNGSLTDAANSLFLSQSTLSHRIAQLEKEVGMCLIKRGRGIRKLTLTSNGQEFLLIARRWADLIHETQEMRSSDKRLKLSIGAIDSVQSYILTPVYQELSVYAKKIDIRIQTVQSSDLYQLLNRGEIDIAFGHLEQPMPTMIIRKFTSEKMVVISKGELPQINGRLVDQELDTDDQLYYGFNVSFRSWYDRWLGDRQHPTIHVDTAKLLQAFMNQPEKWAIVPTSIAQELQRTDHVTIYQLEDSPPERICYQIRPRYPRESAIESLQILDQCIESTMNAESFKS